MKKLMIPRWECIAPMPKCKFKTGEVIELNNGVYIHGEYHSLQGYDRWYKEDFDKYPHLFRKLSWWERREIGEMPEYVKDSWNNVVKAVWRNPEDWEVRSDKSDLWHSLIRTEITIATEQEYQDYLTHLTTPKTI